MSDKSVDSDSDDGLGAVMRNPAPAARALSYRELSGRPAASRQSRHPATQQPQLQGSKSASLRQAPQAGEQPQTWRTTDRAAAQQPHRSENIRQRISEPGQIRNSKSEHSAPTSQNRNKRFEYVSGNKSLANRKSHTSLNPAQTFVGSFQSEPDNFRRNQPGDRYDRHHHFENKSNQHPADKKPDRSSVPGRIKEWIEQSVTTCLVFDMSAAVDDLSLYLKTTPEVPADITSNLVSLLHRAVNTNQKGAVDRIVRCVLDAYFLDGHFILFLDQQIKNRSLRPETLRAVNQMLDVVEYAIEQCPEHGAKCNYSLQQIMDKGKQLGLLVSDNRATLQARKLIKMSIGSQFKKNQEPFQYQHMNPDWLSQPGVRHGMVEPDPDMALPPDDYTQISIFPDTDEILADVAPFLRANKTSGEYRDSQHYLDVHSRLLKEDYLEPIRRGLKDYKEAQIMGGTIKEDNLRFYYDVKLVKMKCDESRGITHYVQFSVRSHVPIDWEHSRRLMYGSLLVLSKDVFETTVFATVSDRDTTQLEKGLVEVTFQNNLDQIFTSSEFDVFVMAETTAYFESYRHVLEGLQEMRDVPLRRYILSIEKDILPPAYYLESPEVDMSCIAAHGRCLAPVEILDEDDWPDASQTILNESQMEAMKLALTKEMAIIQGPPGTGKTYVGLKIMNILFNQMRKMKNKQSPILVVCYTNHALDQFLEGMLQFCRSGIVRVGGRSSSEALEKFNLRELRKNPKMERHVKANMTMNVKKRKKELKTVASYIETYWQQSLKQETSILALDDLLEEVSSVHQHSLKDPRRQSDLNPHVIRVWLRATSADMENHMTKASIRRLAQVIASGGDGSIDSGITNTLSAIRAEFLTRVNIYRYWAGLYRMRLEFKLDQTMSLGEGADRELIQQLLIDQEVAKEEILEDEKLIPFMESEDVFKYIRESVEAESKGFDTSKQGVVREWLLGRFTTVDSLLDAIERLTNPPAIRGRKKVNARGVDTDDDLEDGRFPRRQWVLVDSSDDEGSEDDKDEDDYRLNSHSDEGSGPDDMGDIDDFDENKTKKQKEQFRDIARDFKQFENREIQIYQRALMLGVNMSDTEQESQEDEWQESGNLSHSKVFKLLHSVQPFSETDVTAITDVWDLELRDRYRLYKYWVQERKEKLAGRLKALTQEYRDILALKKEAINEKDVCILRSARVIGMTTSGAAKHRAVLQKVGSQTVVVEEAAEVLEAHIITSLNARVKHLILIGDHQQLRPNPTVHRLAVDYDLEISLFERLVNNGVPSVMLEEQHRMRPEIAQFIRHIYPSLQDHATVKFYGNIEGVASNVFFLQHSFEEKEVDDSTSKANTHEALFLTALCKYFLQHGYEGSHITVLAAYGGQVAAIKEAMEPEESMYKDVRVTSIDNYQGEENDIILLSLVRSNKENKVGFLKTDNRVCVALSRAKKGLFVIGNLKQIAFKSNLWKKILATASQERVTGVCMKLVCVNHKEHETYVSGHEDFQRDVPEGGCSQPCGVVLMCGHICNLTCHSWDRFHQSTPCRQPCLHTCREGHPCPLKCADECGPCMVLVKKILKDCDHEDTVPCHKDVSEHVCNQPCRKMLPCGHECRGACGECFATGKHAPCLEKVEKTWPICGHKNITECYKDPADDPCTTKCKETLNCQHKCKGTCGGCMSGRVHLPCQNKCKKPLPCGHSCEGPCGGECMPCGKRCPTRCRHGPCTSTTCGALCKPCTENCAMVCAHSTCSQRCLDECFSKPCTRTCGKPVKDCLHKCVSLCGEKCVCFTCGQKKFQLIDAGSSLRKQPKQVMAHEQRERARKFELTPDIILMKIPACGDVFTLNQLDKYVESLDSKDTSYIKCPSVSCPAILQGIKRYEGINKQRAECRHARKEKLLEDTKVTFPELSQLRFSLAKVQKYCDIDQARYLHSDNIELKIDPNEVIAFRLFTRFAYALLKIEQIDRKFNRERMFNAARWKRLIQAAKKTCTPQFKEEMRLELHRLLLSEQLVILHTLLKDSYTQLDSTTKTLVLNLKAACKEKMSSRDLRTNQTKMEQLFMKLLDRPEDDYWCKLTNALKSISNHICLCLDEPNGKDLCTILDEDPDNSFDSDGEEYSSEDESESQTDDESSKGVLESGSEND